MPRRLEIYLQSVLDDLADVREGEVLAWPEAMARADPDDFGLAIVSRSGEDVCVGDTDVEFTMQSSSKAIVYAMAVAEHGLDAVLETVGVEPSGEPYNAPSVDETGRPANPMINAGAMATHGLLLGPGADAPDRNRRILEVFSALAGRKLSVDEEVVAGELAMAHANLSIAHMLRAKGTLPDDPVDIVSGYTRQCAIKVTVRDLAMMGATLANRGRHPVTGDQVLPKGAVRQALSVMMTCGMYDATGDWVSRVGIPAKSGVGGGILGVAPGRGGVASYSPPLDRHGNSVRGVLAFERISDDIGLHFLDALDVEDHRWEDVSEA